MEPVTLQDFERLAAEVLPAGPLGYYAGGAADELTLRDNLEAWRRIAIRPRTMVDVSERDPGTTVLGARRPHPLVVAPMAFHRLADAEAEVGSARGAAAAGAPRSSMASRRSC
jgi:4-hydroxymandelate oxidase